MEMDERAYYTESQTTKAIQLNCPFCRSSESYDLRWMVRRKKDRLPQGADERLGLCSDVVGPLAIGVRHGAQHLPE
jgi:hypothetical protein